MTSAPPRFPTALGLALVAAGASLAVFYLEQPPAKPNSKPRAADSRLVSDSQKIADTEQRILASVSQKQAAYEKAFAELNAAGVVRSASLPTRDSIHRRKEMVKRFDEANTALEEAFKNAGATLRSELSRQGFSEYSISTAAARFAQRANVDLVLKICACDRESNQALLQILDLLDARWGTWKPDAEDRLRFNNTADADAYNALRRQIVEIGAARQAAQTEARQKLDAAAKPKP
jgi:hypothetical protein